MEYKYERDLYYVGDKIRERRESLCWSQEELADRMEVSTSTLYRFENGKRVIPVDLLFKFADVLDISILELIPGRLVSAGQNSKGNIVKEYQQLNTANKKVVDATLSAMVQGLLAIQ